MKEYFVENYSKKYRNVFLIFAFCAFIALLFEVFIADTFELADVMMLLSLSVIFFIEAWYPHIYERNEKVRRIPFNRQLLLFLCNFIFVVSLIAKFII